MKKTFDTYKEAVFANGGAKGVYTTGSNWGGLPEHRGLFRIGRPPVSGDRAWVECNPADHLESLASFLASGKRLIRGDLFLGFSGEIVKVNTPGNANVRDERDCNRFILQATADNVETPEEREEFDRLAREHDNEANQAREMVFITTPQYINFSSSEKPNRSDWKNGDALSYWCLVRKDWFDGVYVALDNGFHVVRDLANDEYKGVTTKRMRKPETPAEREERERLEAAYDLCITLYPNNHLSFDDFKGAGEHIIHPWLTIVDKTGYRKEDK